jgi:hypothetical protein
MSWEGIGDFAVEHGRRIYAHARDGAAWAEFRDVLLTNIVALALLERGIESLHASGVERAGRGIAFVGRGGSSKSTLAAMFARRGWSVLGDDILPLRPSGRRILAYPSVGEIKLMPEAARALRVPPRQLCAAPGQRDKCIWRIGAAPGPCPLAVVYFPSISARKRNASLRALSRRDAFRHLLAYNFNAVCLTRRRMRRVLALFSHVAEMVPARRLLLPRGLHRLEEVAERIEADLAKIAR